MAAATRFATLVVLLGLLMAQAPALANEKELPTLGEHEFIPATNIDEPFITTLLQSSVSMGKAMNMTVPVFDVSDSTVVGTAKSNLLMAGLGFYYQQAVKEWLAVNFGLFTVGRVGTSTSSLLSEGITGAFGYKLGWLVRIHESETILLSGSANLTKRNATYINLLEWAQGILEGVAGPDNPLVRSSSSLQGGGGLHFAWGLSQRFGLFSTWKLAYGEAFDNQGANQWNNDIRMAVSYNALPDIKLPLGVALTGGFYESNENGQTNWSNSWFWSVRFGFQAGKDFSVGLDLRSTYVETDLDWTEQFSQVTIDLRYYF